MSTIVVVTQDGGINTNSVTLRHGDVGDSVVLLGQSLLHEIVVLGLDVLLTDVEVKFVIFLVFSDHFCPLQVKTNRQDAAEGEVWVFNVISIHLHVHFFVNTD